MCLIAGMYPSTPQSMLNNSCFSQVTPLELRTDSWESQSRYCLQLQELPDYLKKDCLLFYFPEMEPLAARIAEASSKIELGRIRWA